jgi:hypothetical protein
MWRQKPSALLIRPGQRAQLIINGRYVHHDHELFKDQTYNVAFGSGLKADVFLVGKPDACIDQRADLNRLG